MCIRLHLIFFYIANTEFETQVLSVLAVLQSDVSELKSDMGSLNNKFDQFKEEFVDFREHMEGSIDYLGKLSNQSFAHINEIRAETVSPWKITNK